MSSHPRMLLGGLMLATAGVLFLPLHLPAQDDQAALRAYSTAAGLHNDGAYKLAAKAWKAYLDKNPKHKLVPDAKFYLGFCYYRIGNYAGAVGEYRSIIKDHASTKRLEEVYYRLGNAQVTLGRATNKPELLKQAVATFETLLKKWPEGKGSLAGHAQYGRGDALYSLGDLKGAMTSFKIVADNPKHPLHCDALYSLGVCQQDMEQWEPAGKTYAKFLNSEACKQSSFLTEVQMRYGETLLNRTVPQFTEAEKWLQVAAATKDFAMADYATFRWADSYAKRKKHADAAKLYLSISEKYPKLGNVDLDIARLEGGKNQYLAGDHKAARSTLTPLVPKGGDVGAEAAHWTARSYHREKMWAEMLKVAETALPKAKGTAWEPELMMDRAEAMIEMPDKRKASVAAFAEIANRFPNHRLAPEALYNAAFASKEVGDAAGALKFYDEFRQNAKFRQTRFLNEITYVAAESHLDLRQFDKAAPLYKELLSQDPKHADAEMWMLRLGQCWFYQDKYKETIAELKPHLGSFKTPLRRADAHYIYGKSQYELDQLDDSIKSLQAGLQAAGGAQWDDADNALVTMARAWLKLKQPDRATPLLQTALQKHPNGDMQYDAHYQLGECAYFKGDYKTAVKEYQWVVDNAKQADFVAYGLDSLGWAQLKLGNHEAAVKAFSRLLAEHPKHPRASNALLGRGSAQQALKQYAKAEADFRTFLDLHPNSPQISDVRHQLGKCQSDQDKHAEAVKAFEAILARDKDYANTPGVLYDLAWAYKGLKQPKQAIARFEELHQRFPDNWLGLKGRHEVGELQYADKEYKQAQQTYADVVSKVEGLVAAKKVTAEAAADLKEKGLHKHGWSSYMLGQHDQAEKSFAAQLSAFAEGDFAADARYMIGETQLEQKKYDEALSTLTAYVTKHPGGRLIERAKLKAAQAALGIGQAEDAKAQPDRAKAQQMYKRALNLADGFLSAHKDSDEAPAVHFERGRALHYLGQLDDAEKSYETVTGLVKNELAARSRFMVGEVYFQRGVELKREKKSAEAKEAFEAAVTHYYQVIFGYTGHATWQANARFEAARCFEHLNNKNSAIKNYRALIDKFPKSDKVPAAKKALKRLAQ